MVGSGFRNLIIGKGTYIPSWGDYKNALLRGHLIVVTITVGVVYLITDWLSGIQGNEPYYLAVIATGVITFILNRKQKYKLANILLLSLINLIVFLFASSDQYRTGIYILFVISGIAGFALFGHKEKVLASLFAALSLILFFLSYWFDISIKTPRVFTEEYIQISFAINFTVSLTIGIALLYFLIDVNHATEKELLAKNDLLAKTNRELDRFVYSASHDLRAPLSSLLGLIEVAHKTSDPSEINQCLDLMRQRVNNMDGFIKEIIDFSRNTRQEVRQEEFNLLNFIKEIVDDLKFAEGMEQIYVRLDIAPDLAIISDTTRLKVVLNNLIGNAFKYHDSQKEQPEVYIKAQVEEPMIRIDIEDNGLGIATEHQSKVFEMFYRASEKSQGSGLGLYIVQETLAKLKGAIQLRSTVYKGSTFSVWLPN
ncbi:MAG: HAMP domain-containing histidine kinase [Cyclobacteriaceae bacterium]|jgi:signal transduction histidine kinase|nr:HAMP domain-containing histidine kinase [Cyclobacteriaceae bacterium]